MTEVTASNRTFSGKKGTFPEEKNVLSLLLSYEWYVSGLECSFVSFERSLCGLTFKVWIGLIFIFAPPLPSLLLLSKGCEKGVFIDRE